MNGWASGLILVTVVGSLPLGLDWPAWSERFRHNPRERTEQAIGAYEEERFPEAAERAEEALELGQTSRLRFNAGTAKLKAGEVEPALEHLRQATRTIEERLAEQAASDEAAAKLAPLAHYNLGNALLQAGRPEEAVEAYEQALRRDPGHRAAKFNLELALRRLEEPPPPEPTGGPDSPEREDEGSSGESDPGSREQASDGGDGEPQPSEPGEDGPQRSDLHLEEFEEQPDMSAEEAAAILEAVENLERRQRRLAAAERARTERRGEKDW